MKIKLTFSLSILVYGAFSQSRANLYFVSGHPFTNIETQFPSTILKYEKDSLKKVSTITNNKMLLSYIRVYPELNLLTALTEDYKTKEDQKTLHIVHLDQPDTVYHLKVFLPSNRSCTKSSLVQTKQGVFECFVCYDKNVTHIPVSERKTEVYGYDVNRLERRELSAEDLRFSVASGSAGGAIEGDDYFLLYTNSSDGRIKIPVTADTTLRPLFPLSLPDSFKLKRKKRVAVLCNNETFTAMLVNHTEPNSENIGYSELIVYSKNGSSFFRRRIKGNDAEFRSLNKWIAGDVIDMNSKIVYNEKGQIKDNVKFSRISPGKNERRGKGTSTGAPFDFRSEFLDRYYPGILYLINTETKNYIEWSTGQGDSEILLIENDLVYYRVNDEIYRAPILNGQKLGKTQLLIKNEIVPDIHWAFISNN